MGSRIPHMVVSIDFGMTCTGVAYQNLSVGSETVQWINKWPGRSQAAENKVPTILVYPADFPSPPSSWGFQSEEADEQLNSSKVCREWFKVLLDGERLREEQARSDPRVVARSVDEVKGWYRDYLRKLYEHIEYKLAAHLSGVLWADASVEYVFSVPTTWSTAIVERFREIILSAGFGKFEHHSVIIDLTEAEAAAVFTSRETPGLFRAGDVMLICDAGGGTTDLSVLRVLDTSNGSIRLEQLDVVQGQSIGSTAIDHDFKGLVSQRLADADKQAALDANIQQVAWEMMKSKEFQNVKCEMGSPDEPPIFRLPIRGLASTYKDHLAGIDGGFMSFTRGDLQKLFDRQIDKIVSLVNQQIQTFEYKHPNQTIKHLVLSGGLGNSGYVHQRLSAYYYQPPETRYRSANEMQVRISPDPQLAVCKGMIVNRVQKLRSNKSTIGIRCCRASYGSLCKELYNPDYRPHINMPSELDPLNNKEYVINVVDWYIRKGEPIDSDEPMIKPYKRRMASGQSNLEIASTLVVSDLEANQLPYTLTDGVNPLCDLHATIPSNEGVVHKGNRFKLPWKKGKSNSYVRVDFEIRIIFGPADLRFELWREGQKMSGERSIKVDFAPATDIPRNFPSQTYTPVDLHTPKTYTPVDMNTSQSQYPPRQSYVSPDSAGLIPVTAEYYADSERRTSHIFKSPYIHELPSDHNLPAPTFAAGHRANKSTSSIPSIKVSPVDLRPAGEQVYR